MKTSVRLEACRKHRRIERRRWPFSQTGNLVIAGFAVVAMIIATLLYR